MIHFNKFLCKYFSNPDRKVTIGSTLLHIILYICLLIAIIIILYLLYATLNIINYIILISVFDSVFDILFFNSIFNFVGLMGIVIILIFICIKLKNFIKNIFNIEIIVCEKED